MMNGDSLDSSLTLVADQHRRRLINHLRHNGNGEVRIDNLVDQLHQAEPAAIDGRQKTRNQLAIQLNHIHLPKLANHGVIDHDHERGTIEYQPDKQIETVLEGLPEEPSVTNP